MSLIPIISILQFAALVIAGTVAFFINRAQLSTWRMFIGPLAGLATGFISIFFLAIILFVIAGVDGKTAFPRTVGTSFWFALIGAIAGTIYGRLQTKTRKPENTPHTYKNYHHRDIPSAHDDLYERVAEELRQKRLKQGLVAKAFAETDGDKAKAKAAYIRYRVAELQQETLGVPPSSTETKDAPQAHAAEQQPPTTTATHRPASVWKRFVARFIDYMLESSLVIFGISAAASQSSGLNTLVQQANPLSLGITVVPFALLLDVAIHDVFPNTLGKALLGIQIRDKNGKPLSTEDHFYRNMGLWLRGFALGLPFISVISMTYQAIKARSDGYTTYDRAKQINVQCKPIGVGRLIFAHALLLVIIVVASILNSIQMDAWARSQRVSTTALPSGPLDLDWDDGGISPPPGLKPYSGEIERFLDAPQGMKPYHGEIEEFLNSAPRKPNQ